MKVKEVFYVKQNRYSILPQFTELLCSETIIVSDLVVIQWDRYGLHAYYKNIEMYLEYRFKCTVENVETDVIIIDLGDI